MTTGRNRRMHIHAGDTSASALRASGTSGTVIAWSDVLHEGPLWAGAPAPYRRLRARVLCDLTGGALAASGIERHLAKQDAALERAITCDEVTFWFDGCLYDQLIMVHHLAWLHTCQRRPRRTFLLVVDSFPGLERFDGLGQLKPAQLRSCLPRRIPVTDAMMDCAARVWTAVCGATATEVQTLACGNIPTGLPCLSRALTRWLEEWPDTRTGLGRMDRAILAAVAAGAETPATIFKVVNESERPAFAGDTTVFRHLRRLAECSPALLELDGPGKLPCWEARNTADWRVHLAPAGQALLAGRLRWDGAMSVPAWMGHGAPPYAWNRSTRRIEIIA